MFWRHLSYATKQPALTSTLSKGTALNVCADPTLSLHSSVQQTEHLFRWTVYSWQTQNKFFSALEKEQLAVIKTEREAKAENWDTEVSEKKKLLGCPERKEKEIKIKIVRSFVIGETEIFKRGQGLHYSAVP